MATLQAQREDIRKLLEKRGNGSFFRGWRDELDRDGLLEVHFQSLASFAARHALKLDLPSLFGHDRDRMIPLTDICPKRAALLASLQEFVKHHFGGPLGMVPEGEYQSREGLRRLWQLRGFKVSEEDLQQLLSFIDVDAAGVAGEDLTFLEPDPVARKILGVRLRQKRQQQQQELLAKAFSEDTFELPSHHRLAVRPWHASAFEKLPRLQNQRQHRWRRQHRRRNRQAKELFLAHLKDMSGSVVRAWRMKLDPENRSTMDEQSLRRYCSKAAVQLDVSALWQALDADKDGQLRLEVLNPEAAEVLAQFRKWASDMSGSCAQLWDSTELVEARKEPQRNGRWRSEKKMLLNHLAQVLKQHFALSAPPLLYNSLDAYGCGFVSREDFVWLDRWQPCDWIAATADAEEWAILKALLIRLEGHPLRAWRKRLDKDDSNSVSWLEFQRCFQELNFHGNVPGAWRHVDEDMSGIISLKAYDMPSAQLLSSFKTWAEEHFGSVHRAFTVLDNDGSGFISLPELQRACLKRPWKGDVKMLFRCLDVEDGNHPRLSLAALGFLDNWEVSASESEDERDEARRAQEAPRGSSARRPPREKRSAVPLPELRSQSQPAKRCERTPSRTSSTSSRLTTVSAANLIGEGPPDSGAHRQLQKDPRQEHEQWVQQREQEVQSIYRVASERYGSSSSEVTKRLYHPHVRDPKTGVPSWLHSLREATRSRSEALLPRGTHLTGAPVGSSRSSLKEAPPAPAAPGAAELPGVEPIYRYGSNGSVVGPFKLSEVRLKPMLGEDFSRG